MVDFVAIISIASAIAGIAGFIWLMHERLFPYRKLSWRFAQRTAQKIARQLVANDFTPSLIFGIGRGGAIMGAMISGCLGHRPLLVVDRRYDWNRTGRLEDLILFADVPKPFLKNVLLVAGEIHSGGTMRRYYEYLRSLGTLRVQRAVLFYEKGCPVHVEYYGIVSARKNVRMPWMFSKSYLRADRKPPSQIQKLEVATLTLGLCRHGRTTFDDEDRFCGTSDPDLAERGIEQALEIGRRLKGQRLDRIYASTAKRAMETAKIIGAFIPGTEVVTDRRLNEVGFGDWEGKSREDVQRLSPKVYSDWEANPVDNPPPKAQKVSDVHHAVLSFLEELKSSYEDGRDKFVLAITHKTPIRLIMCHLHGLPLEQYRQYRVENGQCTNLEYDGKRWFVVAALAK